MAAMTACLDDETVLGMVEGRLGGEAIASADEHLDGCDACRDVLAQVARTCGPRALERGAIVGRYVIGELVGSGAMGRVYSAWQPELDRRVAIKVLHGERARVVREAQAMARLDHPNVVGVHEVGPTDDGVFVVMDLVEGRTLRAWAEREPPWRERVRVAIDVARGLAAVHAAGVVHRDVKPDNIIVGDDGRARIGDFGLARAAETATREERESVRRNTASAVSGSDHERAAGGVTISRAPAAGRGRGGEQRTTATAIPGALGEVTAARGTGGGEQRATATAIPGALGEVTAARGSGDKQRTTATASAGALGEVTAARGSGGEQRATAAAITGAPGEVTAARGSGGEQRSTATASAGTPAAGARRIADATAIAGTPAYMAPEVLRGEAATAASDQFGFGVTLYELLARRRPFGGATWAELARAIEREPAAAIRGVPSWLEAIVRRCLAVEPAQRFASLDAVAAALEQRLHRRRPVAWLAAAAALVASGVTFVAMRGGTATTAAAACDAGGAAIAAIWTPEVRARFDAKTAGAIERWTAAWATERDATCREGATLASSAVAARETCLARQQVELAALLERARTRPEGTQPSSRIEAGERAGAPLADRIADALGALSPVECRDARPGAADPPPLDPDGATAVRDVEQGLPRVRAALALGDPAGLDAESARLVGAARASGHAPTLGEALLVRAEVLRATARLPEAAEAAREAAAAAERGHADAVSARAWLTRVAIAGERRELAAAEDLAPLAEAAIDRAGGSSRMRAHLLQQRALVAYSRGRLVDAKEVLIAARAIVAGVAGERSAEVAAVESSLGSTARAAGDLDAAERHHRAALAIDRELRDARHPDLARDLHNLAGVLRLRGDLDGALATYEQALAIELATRGETSTQVGITRNSLALVAMARRDWAGARRELARAHAIFTAAGHGDLVFVEHNLGLVAAATGEHARALAHYQRAGELYAATIGGDALSPIRLHLDRARSLGGGAAARAEAARALEAARRAQIGWIVDEATQFLAAHREPVAATAPAAAARTAPTTAVATDEDPRSIREIGVHGSMPAWTPAPPPELPPPPRPPPTQPVRDVGTYGSSGAWTPAPSPDPAPTPRRRGT